MTSRGPLSHLVSCVYVSRGFDFFDVEWCLKVPFTWCFVRVVGVLCFKSDGGFSGSDCRVVVGFSGFGVCNSCVV